jgi:hypothetical protein
VQLYSTGIKKKEKERFRKKRKRAPPARRPCIYAPTRDLFEAARRGDRCGGQKEGKPQISASEAYGRWLKDPEKKTEHIKNQNTKELKPELKKKEFAIKN